MKITIFGASGKTGIELVEQALDLNHKVTAYVRRKNAFDLSHPNLKLVVGELHETSKIELSLQECEVCLSALGGASLRKHAIEVRNGINNIVTAAEKLQVKRIIYLSSIGAGDSRFYLKQPIRFLIADLMLKVPLADHKLNEERIRNSQLQWTIVRPGGLTNGNLVKKLNHGSDKISLKGNPSISRASVASFMLQQMDDESYLNKNVWLYE